MTNRLDDIAQGQAVILDLVIRAALLAEIEHLDRAELASLANASLAENSDPSEHGKARRMIRGLLRRRTSSTGTAVETRGKNDLNALCFVVLGPNAEQLTVKRFRVVKR